MELLSFFESLSTRAGILSGPDDLEPLCIQTRLLTNQSS